MRYQGRLTIRHDDKGYGFITPNGDGPPVFVRRTDINAGGGNSFKQKCPRRQAQNLRRTRDLLLPRRLSGQIELQTD